MHYNTIKYGATILLILITAPLYAGLDSLISPTARLTNNEGPTGTAIVFKKEDGALYLLTAGHCVNGQLFATFYGELEPSPPIPLTVIGSVYEKGTNNDLALLKIDLTKWPRYTIPTPLTLLPNTRMSVLYSYGCPDGGWPTGVKGRLQNGKFWPTIKRGRSGSGVAFEEGGTTYLTGIILRTDGSFADYYTIQKWIKRWEEENNEE